MTRRNFTDADLDELARRLAARLANASDSRRASAIGIGARVEGDLCDEIERSEFMDRTTEEPDESDGASSSPQQMAAKLLSRSRQRQKLRPLPIAHARKPRAGR